MYSSHLLGCISELKENRKEKEMKNYMKTFVIALSFLMIPLMVGSAYGYCWQDSYGYVWDLDLMDSGGGMYWLAGTVNMGGEVRDAVGTYYAGNLSLSGSAGAGVPFNYNIRGGAGSGPWINISATAGHGTVDVWFCLTDTEAPIQSEGPGPGVE